MICDDLSNFSRYAALGPRWVAAARFLAQPSLVALPDGRADLIPGELWATVVRRIGRPLRRYAISRPTTCCTPKS